MSKKSKAYKGVILLESLMGLMIIVVLTVLIMPIIVQLKLSESQANQQLQVNRYLYEATRDKCLNTELANQSYRQDNEFYQVKIETSHQVISKLSLIRGTNEEESVMLIEER
ncbi:hypothetical protein FE258_00535 [Vagococcus zengguangii]|uniref:Uncharacterized protein n=2 Tax=Vagococcus zengguangii TaxID=2571750 RepID=A0A4D7CSP8_9ENTE|nr:hypothetical protein [Vagococcus zengguangii]QCI85732.1 hypothetical protein FA707_01555 [Vagococcus zengguangii]TLG81673.1 hypothetical protein FE258_00535 [Vagococcus zengguangii]